MHSAALHVVGAGDLSATRPATRRIRSALRWLAAPLKPFYVALFPDRMRPEILGERYGLPLLGVVLCACVAAFALGARLDVGPSIRAEDNGPPPTAGPDSKPSEIKTDREIDQAIGKRTAVARVKLSFGAAVGTPMGVLALGFALLLLARFVGGKPTMRRALTVASIAEVPGAVRSLLTAIVAWRQPQVFPDELDTLVTFWQPQHPLLARLLAGVDVFTCWSVVLVVVGMSVDLGRRKSIAAVVIGFALYLVVTRIIMGAPQ